MSWKQPTCVLFAMMALSSMHPSTAGAQAARQGTAALRMSLRAHHQAPSTETLNQLVCDPVESLMEAALDESEPLLVRSRAVTLLARFPEARVAAFLEDLLMRSTASPLRRASARSLVSLLGEREPDRAVPLVSRLFASDDPLDREAAVWLLARLDTPAARTRLGRQRIVERHRAVVDALRRVADGAIQNRP